MLFGFVVEFVAKVVGVRVFFFHMIVGEVNEMPMEIQWNANFRTKKMNMKSFVVVCVFCCCVLFFVVVVVY